MNTFGQHLLVEYHGCDCEILNDPSRIESAMRDAAEAALVTVVATTFHRFSPQGVSGVLVIEESHLSIHTWPESGYAAVDFYTCGECTPERAHDVLRRALRAERAETMMVHRGISQPQGQSSMQVKRHIQWSDTHSPERVSGGATLGVMSRQEG